MVHVEPVGKITGLVVDLLAGHCQGKCSMLRRSALAFGEIDADASRLMEDELVDDVANVGRKL